MPDGENLSIMEKKTQTIALSVLFGVFTLGIGGVWPNDISNAKVVMEKLDEWFADYNEKALHKELKILSPKECVEKTKLAG